MLSQRLSQKQVELKIIQSKDIKIEEQKNTTNQAVTGLRILMADQKVIQLSWIITEWTKVKKGEKYI